MHSSQIVTSNMMDYECLDSHHSLDTLKEGLGFLLNRYVENKSKTLALKIVTQLEMILSHHDNPDFPSDRCALYRLIRYWRVKST